MISYSVFVVFFLGLKAILKQETFQKDKGDISCSGYSFALVGIRIKRQKES